MNNSNILMKIKIVIVQNVNKGQYISVLDTIKYACIIYLEPSNLYLFAFNTVHLITTQMLIYFFYSFFLFISSKYKKRRKKKRTFEYLVLSKKKELKLSVT